MKQKEDMVMTDAPKIKLASDPDDISFYMYFTYMHIRK